jgi:hypothetical protein
MPPEEKGGGIRAIAASATALLVSGASQIALAKGWADWIPGWFVIGLYLTSCFPLGYWVMTHRKLWRQRRWIAEQFKERPQRFTGVLATVTCIVLIALCGSGYLIFPYTLDVFKPLTLLPPRIWRLTPAPYTAEMEVQYIYDLARQYADLNPKHRYEIMNAQYPAAIAWINEKLVERGLPFHTYPWRVHDQPCAGPAAIKVFGNGVVVKGSHTSGGFNGICVEGKDVTLEDNEVKP